MNNNIKPSEEKKWLQFYPQGANEKTLPTNMTFYQYYINENKKFINDISLEYFGKKYKVADVVKEVERYKKMLKDMGLKVGDSISLASLTTPEFVFISFAANDLAVRVDQIDFVSDVKAAKIQLKNSTNSILFIMDELYDKLENLIAEKKYEKVIHFSLYDSIMFPINKMKKKASVKEALKNNKLLIPENSDTYISLSSVLPNKKNNLDRLDMNILEQNDEAVMVYSSGSENGIPTPYILTNDGITATIFEHLCQDMSFDRGQTFLNVLPSIYSTTITSSLFMPLCLGQKVVIDPRFDANIFPNQIKKYKPHHFIVNSTHMWELYKNNVDMSETIYPIVGGEAIDSRKEDKINDMISKQHKLKVKSVSYRMRQFIEDKVKMKIVPNTDLRYKEATKLGKGYGSSPFGACVTVTNERCNFIGSAGIPLSHNVVGIFDPDTDEELGYNQIGEIRIKTPSAAKRITIDSKNMTDIFKINPHTKEVWGHSEDVGMIDLEGRVYCFGRMSASYIEDGKRKYNCLIEQEAKKHSIVNQCVVVRIASPFEQDKKINVGVLTINQEENHDIEKFITEIFSQSINKDLGLDAIRFRDSMPTSGSGKLNRPILELETDNLIYWNNNKLMIHNMNSNFINILGSNIVISEEKEIVNKEKVYTKSAKIVEK